MQKVDADPIDGGTELAEAVQHVFTTPPIVLVAPILVNLLQLFKRRPLAGVADGFPLRPARMRQTLAQISELPFGNIEVKWLNLVRHFFTALLPLIDEHFTVHVVTIAHNVTSGNENTVYDSMRNLES